MPEKKNEIVKATDPLTLRLNELVAKKYRTNEMYNIIRDFLLNPLITSLIEESNKLHKLHISKDGAHVCYIKLLREKAKKPGFFNYWSRFFAPWETVLKIKFSNGIFLCEFDKYSYFSMIEKIKEEYYEKLHKTFACEFVVINRG